MEPEDLSHDLAGPGAAPPGIDLDAGPSLVLGAADGPHPLGPATIDSDADGLADTVLLPAPDLTLATDVDHDGGVDVLTSVAGDGTSRTVDVGGPPAAAWDAGWDAPAPPGATLDPATGAWTRSS